MKAIFKRELKSYFTSVIGWIFLAAFLFVFALYFVANNLSYASPYLSYSLGNILFVFIILVPILSMRCMADDRRTKTDQLLYTSPVSVPRIILGKYLAIVCVFTIAMIVVALTPIFLSFFGDVPLRENYLFIIGVWFYGCLSIAICVFLSSITESQVIAAVLSFAILFLGYMMESIGSLISSSGNALTNFLSKLSTIAPLENFSDGILDVAGIIYYVSGIVLFLFLTCQIVQKHRWSVSSKKIKRGVFNSSFVVIGIAIAVVVNVFGNLLPENIKNVDLTGQKLYSLTDDTYEVLDALEDDITFYVLSDESDMDDTVAKTLDRYASGSSHITVEYIDPAESPTFYTTYTDDAPTDQSIIAVSGERFKIIDYSEIYESELDYSTYSYTTTGYDGEGQITSAITYLMNEDMPVVYTIDGHGEESLDTTFTDALEKMNVTVSSLTLLETDEVPEDAAAIIIYGPTSDFSEDDAQKVIDYLAGGGKALIVTSYEATDDMSNFESILAEYDVERKAGLVVDSDNSYYYQVGYYLLPNVESADATADVDGYIFAPYSEAIANTESDTENLTWTALLTTSEDAYLKTDLANVTTLEQEDGDETGQFILAANIVDSETGADVTVAASTYLFTDDADSVVSGQNLTLFKGVAETLVADADTTDTDVSTVSIDVKAYSVESLTVSQAVVVLGEIIFVVVVPVILLVIGIMIWLKRRRR